MSKGRGKFLFWGLIIGFIAGIFLAPKKGSDLRREAKEKLNEVKEDPSKALQEATDTVRNKLNSIVDDNSNEENIKISEDEIVISKSFYDEGDIK